MGDSLKPCPFCGGAAEQIDVPVTEDEGDNAGGSCIQCTRCAASSALHFDRKENLVSSWNDRVNDVDRERDAIADRTRYIAGQYQPHSDGRNTFVMLAEWIEKRKFAP